MSEHFDFLKGMGVITPNLFSGCVVVGRIFGTYRNASIRPAAVMVYFVGRYGYISSTWIENFDCVDFDPPPFESFFVPRAIEQMVSDHKMYVDRGHTWVGSLGNMMRCCGIDDVTIACALLEHL